MVYVFSLLILSLSFSNAETTSCAPKQTSGLKALCDQLTPTCIPEIGGADKIAEAMNDPKNKVSDDELFTRLIFAESLASGCDLENPEIYESIAWTLKNRMARPKNYGSGRGVVLKPSQFSSSTGPCDVARRTEFFCPKDAKEFEQAWINASKAWVKTKSGKNPIPTVRHYFFPKHFDGSKDKCAKWKGVPPSWGTPENTVKKIGDCATFHNVKE